MHSQANPWFHKRRGDYDESNYANGDRYTPLFPFGYGLSYTTFNCSIPATGGLEPAMLVEPTAADNVTVTVMITNTGRVAGLATVGVYFRLGLSRFVRFHKMLAGFAKLERPLEPGQTMSLAVAFSAEALGTWDPAVKAYFFECGEYELVVGEDSVTEREVLTLIVS